MCVCVCALSLGFLVSSLLHGQCMPCAYDDVLIVRGVRFVFSSSSSLLPILLGISHSAAAAAAAPAALSCTFLRN